LPLIPDPNQGEVNNYNLCIDKIEKIADDYAIEFLEFTEGTYSFESIVGKWYLYANTSKQYTTKELLEIFKKEKGYGGI